MENRDLASDVRAPRAGWAGACALAAVGVAAVVLSWRRWPDELLDFGRELHTAWRLAAGAVLYRDVDGVYGPLSQTFNGLVFRLLGPGMMTLVTVNLTIFAAITAVAYRLFQRAWGERAALAAGFVLVGLLGLSQLGDHGNYNYATPYAHEVTHGMLALLGLVVALATWVREGGARPAASAGLCWGLCWVLKPEFILAGGVVGVGAVALRQARSGRPPRDEIAAALLATLLPTVGFAAAFSRDVGTGEAWRYATTAWRVVVSGAAVDSAVQGVFSGWDRPWANAWRHLCGTGLAVLVLAVATGAAAGLDSLRQGWARACGAVGLTVALLALLRIPEVGDAVGPSLLGLVLLRLACFRWRGPGGATVPPEQPLLALAAAGLLARMALNGRINHFGFYQAVLALMVVVAVLLAEWPRLLPPARRWGRRALLASSWALLAGFSSLVIRASWSELRQRTLPVGTGADRFLARPAPRVYGTWLNFALEVLRREHAAGSLLVIPEGLMLNYLARMPSPVPPFFLFSFATRGGAEDALVERLERNPPGWVVCLSRDLNEYGIARYGERPGQGARLLAWVDQHYERVATAHARHPFAHPDGDLWVLRRRPAPR